MTRVLMVTDQPFWRRGTGAQQRIWSLARYLTCRNFELVVFYMKSRTPEDRDKCRDQKWLVVEYKPAGTGIAATFASWVTPMRPLRKGKQTEASADGDSCTRTLDDYRWPHAPEQFRKICASTKPHAIIIEYIVWGYLADAVPELVKTKKVIDTHDVLHLRAEQFREREKPHWIAVTRKEEADVLRKFDLILAIQEDEARALMEMVPDSEVMVVGHSPEAANISASTTCSGATRSDDTIRIGFAGSPNHANVDGITWFLEHCWSALRSHSPAPLELVIAGTRDEELPGDLDDETSSGVRWLGPIDSMSNFYSHVDFVINPVRFGTGLKIKTVEALCHGKPIVVHPHSAGGLDPESRSAALIAGEPEEFVAECLRLINSADLRAELSQRGLRLASAIFSEERVYGALEEWLLK